MFSTDESSSDVDVGMQVLTWQKRISKMISRRQKEEKKIVLMLQKLNFIPAQTKVNLGSKKNCS